MFLSSYHPEIFRSCYHWQAQCPCKRSRSEVTEVMTPFSRFRTVTPVWIHIWRWNDAQSLMLLWRGTLLLFNVIRQIFKVTRLKNKSLIFTQIGRFRTVTPVWIHHWVWNDAPRLKQHKRGALFFSRSYVNFQGHARQKIANFYPTLAFPGCNSSLTSPMDLKWCSKLDVV